MPKRAPVITVADRLKAARQAAGKTQLELANEAGLRPEVVSRIERGKCPATLLSLRKLCPVLGVTIDEMVYGPTPGAVPMRPVVRAAAKSPAASPKKAKGT